MLDYPEGQRANLLEELSEEIDELINGEDKPPVEATRNTLCKWLGYDFDDERSGMVLSDGPGDRGIDIYHITEDRAEIIQSKMQKQPIKDAANDSLGPKTLDDIRRIRDYLSSIGNPQKQNNAIAQFQQRVSSRVQQLKDINEQRRFSFTIRLLIGAKGLTEQARSEWEDLSKQDTISIDEMSCPITFELITIDDVLAEKWKETNTGWEDQHGNQKDKFSYNIKSNQIIEVKDTKVFFAKAHDLIRSYHHIGQRIFEDNVRCKIKNSNINKEIAKQIKDEDGIKDFYLLNNGITLIAKEIKINEGRATFKQPGIVNGLQTITTLDKEYKKLRKELQETFEKECYILVRAYKRDSDIEVNKLIRATNNQNRMEERNLKSNEPTQIALEQQFARQGWFYERKQGAFTAFEATLKNNKLWPTFSNTMDLRDKKLGHFTYRAAKKRGPGKYKIADNTEVAQSWLAFIGRADLAYSQKNRIFTDPSTYELAFEKRALQHASENEFEKPDALRFDNQAMPDRALLLAFLLRKAAEQLTPKKKDLKEKRIKDLALDKESEDDKNKILADDKEYTIGLMQPRSYLIFVEIVGCILFRKFGADLYGKAGKIVNKTDLEKIRKDFDITDVQSKIEKKAFDSNSFLARSWAFYTDILGELFNNRKWKLSYDGASTKQTLMHSKDTRKLILDEINDFDKDLKEGREIERKYKWARDQEGKKSLADLFLPTDF